LRCAADILSLIISFRRNTDVFSNTFSKLCRLFPGASSLILTDSILISYLAISLLLNSSESSSSDKCLSDCSHSLYSLEASVLSRKPSNCTSSCSLRRLDEGNCCGLSLKSAAII
uniref:Secreted protein n=1 Tax=Haemonchus placei TaxID=6290 RepID=A0A0N4VZ55_HAEPC